MMDFRYTEVDAVIVGYLMATANRTGMRGVRLEPIGGSDTSGSAGDTHLQLIFLTRDLTDEHKTALRLYWCGATMVDKIVDGRKVKCSVMRYEPIPPREEFATSEDYNAAKADAPEVVARLPVHAIAKIMGTTSARVLRLLAEARQLVALRLHDLVARAHLE